MFSFDSQLIEKVDYDLFETTDGKEICFSENFNKRIEYLPDVITIIVFNDKFNNYVDYLPNQTTHIYFGANFNKPIDNLPNQMKFISFGVDFQQEINCLPDSIEEIRLTQHYDKEIKNLPKMLKTLNIYKKTREIIIQEYNGQQMDEILVQTDEPVSNYYSKYSELKEKYQNINFYY